MTGAVWVRKDRAPWVTDHILELIKDKDNALKRARRTKDPVDWRTSCTIRNRVIKTIRKAKSKFIRDSLENNKNDSKKFWKIMTNLVKGDKGHTNFQLRDTVSGEAIVDEETANYINSYFLNIGPKLADGYEEEWSYDGTVFDIGIDDIATDLDEVLSLIKSIDVNKSSAIDGVSARALRDTLGAIPDKIVTLFNSSLSEKIVPVKWKVGTVIPLQKDGSKSDVANLRPVTLLPVIGKLLEKIVNNRLVSYLEENNILDPRQGGFRSGHSTISTVAYFTNDIYEGLNKRFLTLSTFVDLKKAFDTVNHSILLKKLGKIGVGGLLQSWLKNYLLDRQQRTFANGQTSDKGLVRCGVPQGSILGPTLFLIYINDLKNVLINCEAYLYADDTVISKSGQSIGDISIEMEEDLRALDIWFRKNKLTLNAKKNNYMIFGLRSCLKNI